jgi:excisionase family DNA binding protein
MTLLEVADYLRVHPTTIYRLVKTRRLPAFRVGGDWRFNREDIEHWCRRATEQRAAPDGGMR